MYKNDLPLGVKSTTWWIYFFLFVFIVSLPVMNLIRYSRLPDEHFELKQNEDSEYALYINDEEFMLVDYNEYVVKNDYSASHNSKMALICYYTKDIVTKLFMIAVLTFIYIIVYKVSKGADPFENKFVRYIELAGSATISLGIIPGLIYVLLRTILLEHAIVDLFSNFNLYSISLGAIFIFISVIFRYGITIREDNDLIA